MEVQEPCCSLPSFLPSLLSLFFFVLRLQHLFWGDGGMIGRHGGTVGSL